MRATCRGRVCAGLAAVATIAGLLVAGPGLTAPAAASTSHATSATVVPTRAGGLTATQAMARARATRRGVIATALTTAQSQTTANPDGTLTVTQSLLPVRALRSGQWKNLNADLRRRAASSRPQ